MRNYINLGSCDLGRRNLIIYLDTDEYMGAGILAKHRVRIKYSSEMVRDGETYRLIILKVLKKDMECFGAAMEDLKTKMLICGHPDYESCGGEMMEKVLTLLREDMRSKGWVDSPLGGKIRSELG